MPSWVYYDTKDGETRRPVWDGRMTEEECKDADRVRYVGSFADPTGLALGCEWFDVAFEEL